MFSFQRGTLGKHGQRGILVHVDEGGVKDPLQIKIVIQGLGSAQEFIVRFAQGAHDHLGALAGRDKLRGMAVKGKLFPVGIPAGLNLPHGLQDRAAGLMGRQIPQTLRSGQFQIDAHAVRVVAGPLDELLAGARNGLQMDISVEMVSGCAAR